LRISTREDPLRSYTAWLPSDVTSAPCSGGRARVWVHAAATLAKDDREAGRGRAIGAAASLSLRSRSSTIDLRYWSSSEAGASGSLRETPALRRDRKRDWFRPPQDGACVVGLDVAAAGTPPARLLPRLSRSRRAARSRLSGPSRGQSRRCHGRGRLQRIASSTSRQAASQLRQASAQMRQCS
jgi:hypothetical protein